MSDPPLKRLEAFDSRSGLAWPTSRYVEDLSGTGLVTRSRAPAWGGQQYTK